MQNAGSSLSLSYQTRSGLTVTRLQPQIGAEIVGADLCSPVPEEGTALLKQLTDRFLRSEYQMRWSWRDHDITIWDNRQVQHHAVANEAGPRHVERIMVTGTPSLSLDETRAMATAA